MTNANQPLNTESLISALSLCIGMIVDALREVAVSGQTLKESECRSLAETCVDAFNTRNSKSGYSYKVAAERRSPHIQWVGHDAPPRVQMSSLR